MTGATIHGRLERIQHRAETALESIRHGRHLGVNGTAALQEIRTIAGDARRHLEGRCPGCLGELPAPGALCAGCGDRRGQA